MLQIATSIAYPVPLFHYHSCGQGPHGLVTRIVGDSSDPSRPAPTGRLIGDPVKVVPSNAIYGKYQHVKFNMTMPDYTICMAGKHAPKLSSNNGDWHLSFTTSDFGNGRRTQDVNYHGDLHEYVCASNHPVDCMHHQSHTDVCSVPGGDKIDQLKLHSDSSIWTLQDLVIYDRHLSEDEMFDVMEYLWKRTHLEPCKPDPKHGGRRLQNGEPVKRISRIFDEKKDAKMKKQAYIFDQLSDETFFRSYAGLTISVGSGLIIFLGLFRVVLILEYYPRST